MEEVYLLPRILLLVVLVGALAGCSEPVDVPELPSEPVPTATPTASPTATPAPTATASPTATSAPTAPPPAPTATATATPPVKSIGDLGETATGADLVAALSEGEAQCVWTTMGSADYEAMRSRTLAETAAIGDAFPLECLEPDNAIDLGVVGMSLAAGGLSSDSRACIRDGFAEHGFPDETMNPTDSLRSLFSMLLCLTDEEALALDMTGGEDPLPLPSQLRCISERTDLENLFRVYEAFVELGTSTEPPTPSPELMAAWEQVAAAQEACGLPEFDSPEPVGMGTDPGTLTSATPTPDPWVYDIDADAIAHISVTHMGKTVEYENTQGGWVIKDGSDTPVYGALWAGTPLLLSTGRPTLVSQNIFGDLPAYGLDHPQTMVTLIDDSGARLSYTLGDPTPDGHSWYAALTVTLIDDSGVGLSYSLGEPAPGGNGWSAALTGDDSLHTLPSVWCELVSRLAVAPPYPPVPAATPTPAPAPTVASA